MKKHFLTIAAAILSFAGLNAASGGPDTYGYTWKDSNEPGGPLYNWIEIATPAGGSGTLRSAIACDDCHEANIPLGFNFPFYGTNFNQVSMSSNGTVYFENVYLGLSNSCMPGTPSYTMSQYRFIAHLWDDLAPNYQGGIYTQAFPNYFVIEYYDVVPCCTAGDGDTWQVILFRNGNILMQYKELSNQGVQTDFTIGIQNNPTTGLQYRCDASGIAPANGRAILFSPPTFTCNSVAQNILGPDDAFCQGGSLNLTAGTTAIAQTWSTGAFTSSINVNTAGNYSIFALDTNGCTLRDTIAISESIPLTVALGSDVTACGNAMLDAGNPGLNYAWSEGSTTQTINVTSSGTYSVTVTDQFGCSGNDAINVTINPDPVVALGSDITQCGGTVTLDAGNAGLNFLWNDNTTAQTLVVSAAGAYSVTVTDPNTGCSGMDSIGVTINPDPIVTLGSDITQCGGTAVLDAGNAGMNYLWNDGSTTQMITAGNSGTYYVDVTDPNTGCIGADTIYVTINANPIVTLGSDITQCGGTAVLDAGNAGMSYMWSDSSAAQTFTTGNTGTYFVTVTDPNTGCMGTDSINVTIHPGVGVALGADIEQCGGTALLDAGNTGLSFMWSDSSVTQTITVSSSGTYNVTVADTTTGCSGSDTIGVTIHTPPTVSFTLTSNDTVCVNDAGFIIGGGSPAGGTYSGTGVSGGLFMPSTGVGTYVITYSYTDSNNCTDIATQTVTVDACVGFNELALAGVRLFPNPTNGLLNIETNSNEIVLVEVLNALGEVIAKGQLSNGITKLDLSTRSNGLYFVKITIGENSRMEKVLLQR